jgi:hypothetical protein
VAQLEAEVTQAVLKLQRLSVEHVLASERERMLELVSGLGARLFVSVLPQCVMRSAHLSCPPAPFSQVLRVKDRQAARLRDFQTGLTHNPLAFLGTDMHEFTSAASPDWLINKLVESQLASKARMSVIAPLLRRYPAALTPTRRLPPRPVNELTPWPVPHQLLDEACGKPSDAEEAAQLTAAHDLIDYVHRGIVCFRYMYAALPQMFLAAANHKSLPNGESSWAGLSSAVSAHLQVLFAAASAAATAGQEGAVPGGNGVAAPSAASGVLPPKPKAISQHSTAAAVRISPRASAKHPSGASIHDESEGDNNCGDEEEAAATMHGQPMLVAPEVIVCVAARRMCAHITWNVHEPVCCVGLVLHVWMCVLG